jgi:hypothetical protein
MKTILVLQRGWVVVGDIVEDNDMRVRLEQASVIRRWGTTKGLGQLALSGPQSATVLDACGAVEAHPQTIVLRIPCVEESWPKTPIP